MDGEPRFNVLLAFGRPGGFVIVVWKCSFVELGTVNWWYDGSGVFCVLCVLVLCKMVDGGLAVKMCSANM